MNRPIDRFLKVLPGTVAALCALLVAGCSLPQAQPDPTRYYVLTTSAAKPAAAEGARARVALRAVLLPGFLREKTIQVRVAGNEVSYADESRWAETLEAGITRLLRDGLEGRGGVAHVVTSLGEEHDYDLVIHVLRCEGDRETGVARFTAVVEISSTAPGAPHVARETFTTEVAGWDRQDYGQLAAKLSEAVDQFAEKIGTLVAK